jgi:hypothetical protein
MTFIAQINSQGRIAVYDADDKPTEVTSLEQVNALIGDRPLFLSSTLEFASWHTKDAAVIALAAALIARNGVVE